MAVQPIRLFGDPVLRTPAGRVTDFDKELRKLVKDLTETMLDAPGAGLAAPQIGVGLRVFTYYVDDVARPPDQPEPRPVRGAAGRRGGLPVASRAGLRHQARDARRRQGLGTCTASRSSSRAPSCWPAASSTRPTTSTGSCSSTGSTPRPASPRMKAIREAEWFGAAGARRTGQPAPAVRRGGRSRVRLVFAGTPEAALPSLDALLASAPRGRRGAHPPRRARRPRVGELVASPGRRSGADAAGIEVLQPAAPRDDRLPRAARGARARLLPGRGVRRARAPCRAGRPPARLGQPALLAAARLARRRPGAARDHGTATTSPGRRRSCSRRASTPARSTAWSPRPIRPADTSRRPAGPARRLRRRTCSSRPSTGIEAGAARRPRRSPPRASSSRPRSPSTTRGSTGTARGYASTGRSAPAPPRPAPGRLLGGERLKLGPVAAGRPTTRPLPPGELAVGQDARSASAPAPTPVALGEVQPPGKKPMAAADWARGVRLAERRLLECPTPPTRSVTADRERARRPPHAPPGARRSGGRTDAAPTRPASPPSTCCARSTSGRVRQPDAARLLRDAGLDGRDAAFATELAYGTLRGAGARYDAVSPRASTGRWTQVDPPVLDVLRLGAHQLLDLGSRRTPPSATTVELARRSSAASAVPVRQRGAAPGRRARPRRRGSSWSRPTPSDDPIGHLAVVRSHPDWIVSRAARRAGRRRQAGLGRARGPARRRQRARPWSPWSRAPGWSTRRGAARGPRRPSPAAGRRTPSASTTASPGRARSGTRRPGRRAGRGQPARRAGPGRGAARRARRALARPVRRPRRQGRAARRPLAAGAAGTLPAAEPRAAPRRARRAGRGRRRRTSRCSSPTARDAAVAGRVVRPGAGRRAVHRARRAAPPARGPLAPAARRRGRPRGAAAGAAGGGAGGRPPRRRRRRTPPARRTWPRRWRSSTTAVAAGTTSSGRTPDRCCPASPRSAPGPTSSCGRTGHGTDAMYLALLRRTG